MCRRNFFAFKSFQTQLVMEHIRKKVKMSIEQWFLQYTAVLHIYTHRSCVYCLALKWPFPGERGDKIGWVLTPHFIRFSWGWILKNLVKNNPQFKNSPKFQSFMDSSQWKLDSNDDGLAQMGLNLYDYHGPLEKRLCADK